MGYNYFVLMRYARSCGELVYVTRSVTHDAVGGPRDVNVYTIILTYYTPRPTGDGYETEENCRV